MERSLNEALRMWGWHPRTCDRLGLDPCDAGRAPIAPAPSVDLEGSRLLCPLVLHEGQRDLEEARLELERPEAEPADGTRRMEE